MLDSLRRSEQIICGPVPVLSAHWLAVGEKWRKKTRHKPRNCGNYSLTKNARDAIMTVHTVILCLSAVCPSYMVILAQEWAAVKEQIHQF